MPFHVSRETLEALEWPRVIEQLEALCRTPEARQRLSGLEASATSESSDGAGETTSGLFEPTVGGVRVRLAETDEARSLLDEDLIPPLATTPDLDEALRSAGRGAVLDIPSLIDVKNAAQTLRQVARFLVRHAERSPNLADWGLQIEEETDLEARIDSAIDPDGEICDSASPILADARRAARRLSGTLQKRLERYLSDRDITEHLSDRYFTLRNDRYVLPVRSEAKGRVPGIVHDASRSGSTLFIEPEAVVDLNNRLKQTDLEISREIHRILRDLSRRVGEAGPRLRRSLDAQGWIDLAFARGRLSQQLQGHSPRVEEQGIFELPALRHPLIDPDECVANDIRLGDEFAVLVLSGPNAGGKTVCLKSVALACLFVRAGLHVPCEVGARVDLADGVIAEIGDHQDIGRNLSTFSAHMANLADIVRRAGRNTLVALDEIGVGTDPGEGAALAQSILESLAQSGARVITTTHYNLLKEMADVDPRFQNASVEFDPQTLAPSYRVKIGTPGSSSASAVAARMGMPSDILERADSLLSRDDRQLDRMLSELSTRRATLEAEQQAAARLRAEGEATRSEYRKKLEKLQERRDKLFHSMRDDLDLAFQRAHGEVADVIRDLQRGPSSQQAAEARSRLLDLQEEAERRRDEAGVPHPDDRPADLLPVDWRQVVPGDSVELALGGTGVIESLPDRKGRVGVRVGGKKLMLPAEHLGEIRSQETAKPQGLARGRISVTRAVPSETEGTLGGGRVDCDLRGERVAAALDRLREVLDRAAADGRDGVRIVHGIGTGALRSAVREELALSDYVTQIRPAPETEGGEGVTLAELRTDGV